MPVIARVVVQGIRKEHCALVRGSELPTRLLQKALRIRSRPETRAWRRPSPSVAPGASRLLAARGSRQRRSVIVIRKGRVGRRAQRGDGAGDEASAPFGSVEQAGRQPDPGAVSVGASPWAVVLHHGRRSGRSYRTPVCAFRQERTLVIALLSGEESERLRNLSAGPGWVVRPGRTFELVGQPRITDTGVTAELAHLSPPARAYCGLAAKQALLEIGDELPGFGPRRRHG
jgi:hypothetical protein